MFYVYIHIHRVHAWCQQRSKEVPGSRANRATDGCEPPCVWEPNPVLQEQQALLITEPSLQTPPLPPPLLF